MINYFAKLGLFCFLQHVHTNIYVWCNFSQMIVGGFLEIPNGRIFSLEKFLPNEQASSVYVRKAIFTLSLYNIYIHCAWSTTAIEKESWYVALLKGNFTQHLIQRQTANVMPVFIARANLSQYTICCSGKKFISLVFRASRISKGDIYRVVKFSFNMSSTFRIWPDEQTYFLKKKLRVRRCTFTFLWYVEINRL